MQAGSDISTRGFEIGNIGITYFVAANKFCFARPHLMLLTSDGHQKQHAPLHENDLEAACTVFTAINGDYVAPYNCGKDGGCSRLHKHLQLMPMPEDSSAAFLDSDGGKEASVLFQWFYHRFRAQNVTSANLIKVYAGLLHQTTKSGEGRSELADHAPPGAACPHNMRLTNR
jgi:ATP adenylyltransferase